MFFPSSNRVLGEKISPNEASVAR